LSEATQHPILPALRVVTLNAHCLKELYRDLDLSRPETVNISADELAGAPSN
jgi:hypothetical protein